MLNTYTTRRSTLRSSDIDRIMLKTALVRFVDTITLNTTSSRRKTQRLDYAEHFHMTIMQRSDYAELFHMTMQRSDYAEHFSYTITLTTCTHARTITLNYQITIKILMQMIRSC